MGEAAEYMLEYLDMAVYGAKTLEEKSDKEADSNDETKAKAKPTD